MRAALLAAFIDDLMPTVKRSRSRRHEKTAGLAIDEGSWRREH